MNGVPYFLGFMFPDVQPCHSSPCLNGGTCKNDGDTFTCTCFPGYQGDRCENEGNIYSMIHSTNLHFVKSILFLFIALISSLQPIR